jgi:mono/diheme cytochrome c family protein
LTGINAAPLSRDINVCGYLRCNANGSGIHLGCGAMRALIGANVLGCGVEMSVRASLIGAICGTLWLAAAVAQAPSPTPSEPQRSKPAAGLPDLMVTAQLRHMKLWFAGRLSNWKLAAYEFDRIRSALDDAAALYSGIRGSDEASRALLSVQKAIEAKDATGFVKAYTELTNACNACHRANDREFVTIQAPSNSPFSDQLFADQVTEGRALARQICGTCHVVSDDSRQSIAGRPPTPSFADLVRRPSFSADGARQFLLSDHRRIGPEQAMPNPRLAEYQVEEIVAYLETLKAKQGR